MNKKNWKRLSFLEEDSPIDLRIKIKRKNTFCHYCNSLGHPPGYCGTHGKEIILQGYQDAQLVEFYSKSTEWKVGQPMKQIQEYWMIKAKLNHGKQEFKFLVDKQKWVISDQYKTCYNSYGTLNNYIYIIPAREEDYIILHREKFLKNMNLLKIEFELNQWSLEKMLNQLEIENYIESNLAIEIWGQWDQWSKGTIMKLTNKNENCKVWICTLTLPKQKLQYKFKINNQWVLDPYREITDHNGIENHIFDPIQINDHFSDFEDDQKNDYQIFTENKINLRKIKIEEMQTMDLWGHSMNIVNKQIFIIGGVGRNSYTNLIYKVNPINYSINCIDMDDQNGPDLLAFHKTICYGDKIIVYGGQNEYEVSNKYHTFNCRTEKWTSYKFKHNMHKREHFSAVLKKFTCRIFFFGGYYFHPDTKEDKMYNDLLMLNLKLMNFVKLKTKNDPEPRCHHSSVMLGWNLFIFGGCSISNYLRNVFNDVYKINVSLDSSYEWQKIQPQGNQPQPRYGHMCLKHKQYMIIHGGKSSQDGLKEFFLKDLWIFNLKKFIWTEIQIENMEYQRAFHDGCIYKNKIIIFGGKCSNKFCQRDPNSFYEIDLNNKSKFLLSNQFIFYLIYNGKFQQIKKKINY